MAVIKFKLSLKDFLDRWCCTHAHMWGIANKVTELRLQPDLSFLFRGIKVANRCVVFATLITSASSWSCLWPHLSLSSKLCSSLNWQQHLLYRMVTLKYVFTYSLIEGRLLALGQPIHNPHCLLLPKCSCLQLVISQQRKLADDVSEY